MRAVIYDRFGGPPSLSDVPVPDCPPEGVLIEVAATGLCRSDWHGWMGHDEMISLPHVPGHEFAGTIAEIGSGVKKFRVGDHVTAPFVCGCGYCEFCQEGHLQVCPQQTQPGFTHWGSFAEFVAVYQADANLVEIPKSIGTLEAASLGCRFSTAFHGLVDQVNLQAGETIAIFGCGGVGLSTILIANALDAKIIAIDVSREALEIAASLGADTTINAADVENVPEVIFDQFPSGVHVTVDALGSSSVLHDALASLRKRGRHLQIGLMSGLDAEPAIPMDRIIADELQMVGAHGIAAHRYPDIFRLIEDRQIPLEKLIGQRIPLDEAADHLMRMSHQSPLRMTMIKQC